MITSSKISSAPFSSARSRSSSRNPRLGGHEAHVGRVGLGDDRRELVLGDGAAHARRRSFQGTTTVAAAAAAGTPGLAGMPCVARPVPASASRPSDVAVVGAGELQELLAAGRRAGEAHRAHRRLGARRGHPQHLDARHPPRRPRRRARPRPRSARRSSCRSRRRDGDRLQRPPGARGRGSAGPTSRRSRRSGWRRRRRAPRPAARSTNSGSRPIARIARTGELTPPGSTRERPGVELGRARVGQRDAHAPCACSHRRNSSVKYSRRTFLNSVEQ